MQDVKKMLEEVPDYIAIKRYGNSLTALQKRYPDNVPSHIVALALEMTEDQVEERYQQIVSCLKSQMGIS
jgi:uncharacterized membrane protein YheB (UPF0754 family)